MSTPDPVVLQARKWTRYSASQLAMHDRCPRRWWFASILGVREQETEQNAFGKMVHQCVEDFVNEGKLPDPLMPTDVVSAFRVLITHLRLNARPAPGTVWSEHKFQYRFPYTAADATGEIDIVDLRELARRRLRMVDMKTSGNPARYAKREADLVKDPQSLLYSAYLVAGPMEEAGHAIDTIVIEQVNVGRYDATNVVHAVVEMGYRELQERWMPFLDIVDHMSMYAQTTDQECVPAKPGEACNAFKRVCPASMYCSAYRSAK